MSDSSTAADDLTKDVQTADKFSSILLTLYVSLGAGGALLLLFEALRGRHNRMCRCLYRQRHSL
jgi:hypothetical protein